MYQSRREFIADAHILATFLLVVPNSYFTKQSKMGDPYFLPVVQRIVATTRSSGEVVAVGGYDMRHVWPLVSNN